MKNLLSRLINTDTKVHHNGFVIPAKAGIQFVTSSFKRKFKAWIPAFAGMTVTAFVAVSALAEKKADYVLNDAHFHLTNYIQEGTDIHQFLKIMGDKVGRSTLFGIPLQQTWSYASTGDFAPWYYLQTDAPLYYYSFTDAAIAMTYKSLSKKDQARFDPMITGFNPTDMYAADHIRRVLTTFPGVFSGIGEFTIHKEFVSSKIAGEVATLTNPALDRILDFAGEVGLPVILHCDVNMPFPKPNQDPYIVKMLAQLLARHPNTTIIWAHVGLGRVVRPVDDQVGMIERAINNPKLNHVNFDLSWDETAKYVISPSSSIEKVAGLMSRYPNRFLFGTDEVAPTDQKGYLKVLTIYSPLLEKLTAEARNKFLKSNYERIFDAARRRVRAWEKANVGKPRPISPVTPISGLANQ